MTAGQYTERFESELVAFLNVRHRSFVNSGSSANLLSFMTLASSELAECAILRGDEVIALAGGFLTAVAPII